MVRIRPNSPDELKARLMERELVLFGAGRMGQQIAEYCDAHGIPVACFADNKAAGQIGNRRILPPRKLMEEYPDAHIVVSSNIYYDELKQQLLALGFPEERILSYKLFFAEEVTWKDLDGTAQWERMRIRVRKLAEWLDPDVRSVVDYGAGEMYLGTLLSPEVRYYPIDYIERSPETILCDLNTGNFPEICADAAVLSGVLEFLTTAESLLDHVCKTTRHQVLLSYMTLDKFPGVDGRRTSAYVNDYTEADIVRMLARNGFALKATSADPAHEVNTLFLFEKVHASDTGGHAR